jgi:RimJ/RimL family protein N-acetyltransferase
MMTFARTRDFARVRAVLTDATQYAMAGDDSTPPAVEFRPNEDPRIVYIAVQHESGAVVGIVTLIPENCICFALHAALLRPLWGARSREALRGAVDWAWRETPARRIVAAVPEYNRLAIKLAMESGFEMFGWNPRAFLKGGQLHNVLHLGVSRP